MSSHPRPDRRDELPARSTGYDLLVAAAVALLPHLARFPWWLTPALAALFTWRILMLRRGWPAPGRWLRVALTALFALLVYRHYGTIFGRDAGSALLAVMLALKFLELRRLRDYMLSVFLVYFLIVVGFLYSQEPWLVLYLLAVFITTTMTLVRLALPGLGHRHAMRLTFLLFVQALPLMLVMHLLFPRIQGALWGLPQDAYAGMTGMSEKMRPGSINELSLSEEVAFRAYFNTEPPPPATLYWRTMVLTDTDGQTWTRATNARASPEFQPDGPALAYTLVVEPSNKPWLPALELPARAPARVAMRSGFTLEAAQPIRERKTFDLVAYPRYRALRIDAPERRAALALPPQTSGRVRALADALRAGRDDVATVRSILQYFHAQNFSYTLTPPLLGADPVDEFLFETRRGFCEHYAAAFVVLARAAGIPARVVAGYQGGEFNPAGRYYIVRQSDAHAWAEIWLAGRGWTRVDPTAAVSPERIEYGAEVLRRLLGRGVPLGNLPPGALDLRWFERIHRDTRLALDTVRSGWQRWVLGYNPERQHEFLAALGLGEFGAARLVGILAGVVALILAGYLIYNRPRPPRLDPTQRAYRIFCRKLERIELIRLVHEGPRDFAARCAHRRPDLSRDISLITDLYARLRYGEDVRPEVLRDFVRQVRRFRVSM